MPNGFFYADANALALFLRVSGRSANVLQAVNVGSVIGTPKKIVLEQLEIFAHEVMPAFKSPAMLGALAK